MKTSILALVLLVSVGCADETETTDMALGQSIAGTWKITTTLHDAIPCAGEMTLAMMGANALTGAFHCLDTAHTPDSAPAPNTAPNEYWITYGNVVGTVRPSDATISLRGGTTAIFTDTVTLSGNTLSGEILDATR